MAYGMNNSYRQPGVYKTGQKVGGNRVVQQQIYTPQQMQIQQRNQGLVAPGSYLSRLAGGDEELFNEMEAPAYRQFSELQGNLASRFSGMGMGARRSSGFQNTANAAASNFAQDLMARRQELQRNAISSLHDMSQELLGNRSSDISLVQPKQRKPKWWQSLIGGAAPAIGGAIGGRLGGAEGARIGYGAGQGFSNAMMQ